MANNISGLEVWHSIKYSSVLRWQSFSLVETLRIHSARVRICANSIAFLRAVLRHRFFLLLLTFVFALTFGGTAANPVPLPRAHAHNDYEHSRPLLDALDHGFCSVEADIYLVNDQLLVAHDRDKVRPDRTLQSLYLDPLRKRIEKNGGRVYPNGPEVLLLIDIKSDAESTYRALDSLLEQYSGILTRFEHGEVKTNAVTVVISGNRPLQVLAGQPLRYAGIDGRLPDLKQPPPNHLVPLISDNWNKFFTWRAIGPLPENERKRLRELVAQSHAAGRKIRFWAVPDNPAAWKELWDAGVDLINTDNLSGLREFMVRSP